MYTRLKWSTVLASLIMLLLQAWHYRLPSFIYWFKEQGHLRPLTKVHFFFPVTLLIFWEADGWYMSRTPNNTTCWNPRNESYNSCILICHCLMQAVENHHLKTRWETCVGTSDTARELEGVKKKRKKLNHNTCFILSLCNNKGQVYSRVLKPDHTLKSAPFLLAHTMAS